MEFSATLAVSDAAAPVLSWSPECGAASLLMRPADGVGATWYIQTTNGQNTLQSGIVYGVLPDGAGTIEPPVALVNGREYQVSLLVNIEVEGGVLIRTAGETTFVK